MSDCVSAPHKSHGFWRSSRVVEVRLGTEPCAGLCLFCGIPCAADLFPDWPEEKRLAFYMDKEQRFRDMAGAECLHVCLLLLNQALGWRQAAPFHRMLGRLRADVQGVHV
jgi:hypothetical protein